MKRFLLVMMSVVCLFSIISCGEPTSSSITKEEMSTAFKAVSSSMESSNEKDLGEETCKKIVKSVINTLDCILENTDLSVNTVVKYEFSNKSQDLTGILQFLGSGGKIMYSYKDSVIKAAISKNGLIGAAAVGYIEINYDFTNDKLNSFEADFMLFGTLLFKITYSNSKISFSSCTSGSSDYTNFANGVLATINNSSPTITINLWDAFDKLSTSLTNIKKQAVEFIQNSNNKSVTMTMNVGGNTLEYKSDGNGVWSIGDGNTVSFYLEKGNDEITYYFNNSGTWYKKSTKPDGLKLPGDYSIDKIFDTAVSGSEQKKFYGYNFDTKTFSLEAKLDLDSQGTKTYTLTVKFNSSGISEISIKKDNVDYAGIKFSNIGNTTITGFADVKDNACVEN